MLAANQKMSNKFLHFPQHIDTTRKKSCLTFPRSWKAGVIVSMIWLTKGKASELLVR
jgi:hypothetical protein